MAIDDIANTQLGNIQPVFINFLGVIMWIVVVAVIIGFVSVIVYFLMRFLSYSTDIEIWEQKGEEVTFFGDDKARRLSKKGVSYISFLKNKGDLFKNHFFPTAEYIYRKKLFGSKAKFLIIGDELVPAKIALGNPSLVMNTMPAFQKIDYLQRMDKYEQDYKKSDNRAQMMTLVVGVTLITLMLFGLFVIWQSNIATAEATKALAGAISQNVAAMSSTLPVGAP